MEQCVLAAFNNKSNPIYPGPANFLSVLSFHSTDERCNFRRRSIIGDFDARHYSPCECLARETTRSCEFNQLSSREFSNPVSPSFLERNGNLSFRNGNLCHDSIRTNGTRLILAWPKFPTSSNFFVRFNILIFVEWKNFDIQLLDPSRLHS